MMKSISDAGARTFARGPEVNAREPLLTWLGHQSALLRLPVVLARGPMGFSTAGARIGGLEVHADDSKLGIGLADRARSAACDTDAATCALWLEGYWRGEQDGYLTFEVIRVGESISAEALAGALHAEVENL